MTRLMMKYRKYRSARCACLVPVLALLFVSVPSAAQELEPVVPPELRGKIDFERMGTHDANRLRTRFFNYGMVGDFEVNPDLSVFHSVEVPKGTGLNYSDGITPFVLAKVTQEGGLPAYIMETGFRERQGRSPHTDRIMRFEPRPGYVEEDPTINKGRAIAISNDPRTWPGAANAAGDLQPSSDPEDCWIDKIDDPDDPGWCGSWNGFFGKRPNADQETFFVMDDNFYDAWNFFPDERDATRRGLALRVEVRGFQWANIQSQDVIFWHYDIVNEGTTTYEDIVFGLYMDSGVGGSARSCDGIPESDDDNAFYDKSFGLNLVYTWDTNGHGVSLSSNCADTGYLGYAFLETPGNAFNAVDDDEDGITDEQRDAGPGEKIVGQDAIRAYVQQHYNMAAFEQFYGPLEERPAYIAGVWWTGDEDMDWLAEFNDTGADGIFADDDNPVDAGELDGVPTNGEPNFDRTDVNESDMIGLTGFKMNRIRAGQGNPSQETDGIVFFDDGREWPKRLYDQFTNPNPDLRFDDPLVKNYNIGFLFASGPFTLEAGRRERFSLALAYGSDLTELRTNVETVQSIYAANYQFATPPPAPNLKAFEGDGYVTLVWDNAAEKAVDPVSNRNDFEGYRVYRSTDPNFLDPQVITNARGTGPFGIGKPLAQFDVINDFSGYSTQKVQGTSYWLGTNTGITHTFTDTTVTNGQTYYYAVTAYDHGSEKFNFFPSENSVSVSRTPRGGTILPSNVVQVRPNPPVPGYVPASVDTESIEHVSGTGEGTVDVRVVNSSLVPDGHEFRIDFHNLEDSVRAMTYSLTDVTTGKVLFDTGRDLEGLGAGPVAAGVLPVINTPETVSIDQDASGFRSGSETNTTLQVRYAETLPINLRRPGFPEDLVITFSDSFLDTTMAAIGAPSRPIKFKVESAKTGEKLDLRFADRDDNGTLNLPGEAVEMVTYTADQPRRARPTWNIQLDTTGVGDNFVPPQPGDVFDLVLDKPFSAEDSFTFTVEGERVDPDRAQNQFGEEEPYVVPNPYVAAAAFEPERFAVSGRGERRLEFRAIPSGATIRIYTVRGDLVETLRHDGSTIGMVPWNLRSKDNLEVAPGLYIFHVDAGELGEHVGKFAIIK